MGLRVPPNGEKGAGRTAHSPSPALRAKPPARCAVHTLEVSADTLRLCGAAPSLLGPGSPPPDPGTQPPLQTPLWHQLSPSLWPCHPGPRAALPAWTGTRWPVQAVTAFDLEPQAGDRAQASSPPAPTPIPTDLSSGTSKPDSLSELESRVTLALESVTTKCRGLRWHQGSQGPDLWGERQADPPPALGALCPRQGSLSLSPRLRPCSSPTSPPCAGEAGPAAQPFSPCSQPLQAWPSHLQNIPEPELLQPRPLPRRSLPLPCPWVQSPHSPEGSRRTQPGGLGDRPQPDPTLLTAPCSCRACPLPGVLLCGTCVPET